MKYLLLLLALTSINVYSSSYTELGNLTIAVPILVLSNSEANCLTEAIYFEARGESSFGQYLVAKVIIHRVGNKHPPTICRVVYERSKDKLRPLACQFSYTCSAKDYKLHRKERAAYTRAAIIARIALDGDFFADISLGVTHYTRCDVSPEWKKRMIAVQVEGHHCFLKEIKRVFKPKAETRIRWIQNAKIS